QEQVAKFTHTCFMVAPYESYVAVCEQLIALTPGSFDKRSALFNSGAEAVENAVKVARHATGRQAVVVFDHAYHGRTNLTMALTGVTGRSELMDAVHAGGLGGTYGGNPIACAASLAAIETMRELDLAGAARRIESVMLPALQSMADRDPGVGEARGRGAMLAI